MMQYFQEKMQINSKLDKQPLDEGLTELSLFTILF